MKINVIISKQLATYKDNKHKKHQITGLGLDEACPNNFEVVATINCEKQVYIELQSHLFMFSDLTDSRLQDVLEYISKLDMMRHHAVKCDDFEHLYFSIFSKANEFNLQKVRAEIEHDTHHVLDFRTIYYFVRNAVNSYEVKK